MLSSENMIGAFFSFAIFSNTVFVSGMLSPMTTGVDFFIIPAFSVAI